MKSSFIIIFMLFLHSNAYENSPKSLFIVHLKMVDLKVIRKKLAKNILFSKHSSKMEILKNKMFSSSHRKSLNKLLTHTSLVKSNKTFQKTFKSRHFRVKEILPLELFNQNDIQYWGTIGYTLKSGKIVNFNILFDTGSIYFWLASTDCESCAKYHIRKYHKGENENLSESMTIEYGTGTVAGNLAKDDFILNGKEIKDQYFLQVKKMKEMPTMMFDGLIGLGSKQYHDSKEIDNPELESNKGNHQSKEEIPQDDSKKENLSFLFNMVKNGIIKEPVFSFYMSSLKQKHKNPTTIIFGGYKDELKNGEFTFCSNNVEYDHWNLPYSGFKTSLEGTEKNFDISGSKVAIDSGTSSIVFPDKIFRKLLKHLKAIDANAEYFEKYKSIYLPEINEVSKIPKLIFKICDHDFPLEPEDYSVPFFFQNEEGIIFSKGLLLSIIPMNLANSMTVLGIPFFHRYYVLFDATKGDSKVGIALANHPKISDEPIKKEIIVNDNGNKENSKKENPEIASGDKLRINKKDKK